MFYKKKGFTFIEIVVVVAIISLLAAAGAASYTQLSKQSRDAKRKADLEQIRAAIEMYRSNSNSGLYPTNAGGCSGLVDLITPTKYIERIPEDPVSSYYYRCDITASDYTLGAHLEGGGTNCTGNPLCGTSIICNYCLGPYGQK